MKRILGICAIVLTIAVAALAAEFWESKPYTQWSARDVRRMVSDSPWAQTFVLRSPNMVQTRRQTGQMADRAGEGEGTINPEVDYLISVRTAEPVREAVVREAAIQTKYESMDAAGKKAFDERWNAYLAQPVGDKVIFDVVYRSNSTDIDRELAAYWQTQTLDTTKVDTYMIGPDGRRVEPIAFVAGKGASRQFQIAFPRPQAATEGAIAVEFRHPTVTSQPATRVYAKFNFKNMNYKGKLTY
jgi:hypothetical protein